MKKVVSYCCRCVFFMILFLFFNGAIACDNSTISIQNAVDNGDGTTTYTLNLFTDIGGLDVTFYGFVLEFQSSVGTPTVTNFPATLTTADLTTGSFNGETLTGLTGNDVNSVNGDSDWNKYDNTTNTLSYEDGSLFGSASNDFSLTIVVTVDGCVETIMYDGHVNSGASQCRPTVSTGNSCGCTATIAPAATDACQGATSTLTSGIGGTQGSNPVYSWTSSDFTITNANQSSASIAVPAAQVTGTYAVSLTYTDDNGCNLTQATTFDVNFCCSDDVGTQSPGITGSGSSPAANEYILCNGDQFTLSTSGAIPSVDYAIYTSAPTGNDPSSDVGYSGYYFEQLNSMTENCAGDNSPVLQYLISVSEPYTNNTVWWVPITTDITGTYDPACYDMDFTNKSYKVIYLNPIEFTENIDCPGGNVTVTLSGGYPEFFSGNYNLTITGPGSLSSSTVSANGGTVVVSGLSDGDTPSFDVVDDNGCPVTYTGSTLSCACPASVGTISVSGTGVTDLGGGEYDLDDGGTINFNATGEDLDGGNLTYGWAVFDCDPGLPLSTGEIADLTTHSCYLGSDYGVTTTDDNSVGLSATIGIDPVWILPYTSDVADAIDNDGNGCYDIGNLIKINYLDPIGCDCASPNCANDLITDPANPTFNQCEVLPGYVISTTITNYYSLTTGTDGTLGFTQLLGFDGSCATSGDASNTLANRTYALYAVGDCDGTPITATTANAGYSSTLNPEWNNLSPNTDYILMVSVPVYSCGVGQTCLDYYYPQVGCGVACSDPCTPSSGLCFDERVYDTNYDIDINVNAGATEIVYVTVNSGSNGFIGTSEQVYGSSYSRSAVLYATCGGSSIAPTVTNANGLGSGFNPEWTGLTPNTDYILAVSHEDLMFMASSATVNIFTYSAPDCNTCSATIGTLTVTGTGLTTVSTTEYNLDDGGTIDFSTAGEVAPSGGQFGYAVFDCDPGLPFSTSELNNLFSNSCYLGSDYGSTTSDSNNGGGSATIGGLSPIWIVPYTSDVAHAVDSDNDGCYEVGNAIQINYLSCNVALNTSSTDVTCNGAGDGTATIVPSGGTGPYTYTWPNGEDKNNLDAGVYVVTVTDALSCQQTTTVTINEPAVFIGIITLSDASCGQTNGSAGISMSGGNGGEVYAWSNGSNTTTATGLGAGIVSVTVTDSKGCEVVESAMVNNPSPSITVTSSGVLSCNGDADGTASVAVSGGVSPITYLWSTGSTVSAISGLSAGNYTLTVQDANNCLSFGNADITEPDALSLILSKTDIQCNGAADGSINSTLSGGTPNYTYLWSNASTTANLSGLSQGTYTLTATDNNGCEATSSATINEPTVLSLSTTVTDIICNGNNNGSIVTAVAGGTPNYTYNWSNNITSSSNTNLGPGVYTVSVTDANNCQHTATLTVTEPTNITVSVTTTDATCGSSNGVVMSSVAGGNSTTYTYAWNTGQTTTGLTGLDVGTYNLTVADANGCEGYANNFISNDSPSITITTPVNLSCFGDANGVATVAVSGGTPGYDYLWSTGATTSSVSGLTANTYQVSVTDQANCLKQGIVQVYQPDVLILSDVVTSVSCYGNSDGAVAITVQGGTSAFTYNWSDGQNTASASNLSADIYELTVTDANNCSVTGAYLVDKPNPLEIDYALDNPNCFGTNDGFVSLFVSGGTGNYTYNWSNGSSVGLNSNLSEGSYLVTVNDANNCVATGSYTLTAPAALSTTATQTDVSCGGNSDGEILVTPTGGTPNYAYLWSTGSTLNLVTGLSGGVYVMTLTDANGCEDVSSITLLEPLAITATVTATDLSCYESSDGAVVTTVFGGTTPYAYLWSNGDTSSSLSGISNGIYTFSVTDANLCNVTVNGYVLQPTVLMVSLSVTDLTCDGGGNDGAVASTVSGGALPYSYVWSNNSTETAVSGLSEGVYVLTVSDNNNCSEIVGTTLTEPAKADITITPVDNICQNDSTVILSALPSGGIWTGSNVSNANTGEYTINTIGDEYVTYEISGTCGDIDSILVNVVANPTITYTTTNESYFGAMDGSATVVSSSGASPYNYIWETGETTSVLNSLAANEYQLLVTDANNCALDTTVVIDLTPNESHVYVPNIFTPNGDGQNDELIVFGQNVVSLEFRIFDRWGELVFETNQVLDRWDGTYKGNLMNSDVYVYTIYAEFDDGRDPVTDSGNITLIR